MKKKTKIGTWRLGCVNIELFADPNATGGDFYFHSHPETKMPRMHIGFKYDNWAQVLNVLLHETFEFLASLNNHRYEPDAGAADHASYLFSFTHTNFSAICQDQAAFLANAIPALATAFNKHKKAKKK